jgi:hypothetical protein
MILHFDGDHEFLLQNANLRKHMLRWPSRMQSIFRLAGLVTLLSLSGNLAFGRTPESAQETTSWVQEHLLNPESRPPFSFVYGRDASESLLKEWPRTTATKQLDSNRTEHTVVWTDPKTHLRVHLSAVVYADSQVVELNLLFANDGNADTPVLEDIQALDISVSVTGERIPTINYSRGCGGMDTYALRKQQLNQL